VILPIRIGSLILRDLAADQSSGATLQTHIDRGILQRWLDARLCVRTPKKENQERCTSDGDHFTATYQITIDTRRANPRNVLFTSFAFSIVDPT